MNIIALAFSLAEAVERFIEKARRFYYYVMLVGHVCPRCQGQLSMIAEGRCRCDNCRYEFDPTEEFQRCPACGGKVKLRIRRYQCQKCGRDVPSRFLFEGLVFDAAYFKLKVAQSRQRKSEQRERVRQMLAESRSGPLRLEYQDLGSVLIDALNSLTQGLDETLMVEFQARFDLKQYQDHILSSIDTEAVNLRTIAPLIDNPRLDLIWRFVAIIFLCHYGRIDVQQEKGEIVVARIETE